MMELQNVPVAQREWTYLQGQMALTIQKCRIDGNELIIAAMEERPCNLLLIELKPL